MQSELKRKHDAELSKMKKDFELINIQHESAEASLRKKHQDAVQALTEQVEHLSKHRNKFVLCLNLDYIKFKLYNNVIMKIPVIQIEIALPKLSWG